jgi:hypothetical protein
MTKDTIFVDAGVQRCVVKATSTLESSTHFYVDRKLPRGKLARLDWIAPAATVNAAKSPLSLKTGLSQIPCVTRV